MTPLSLLCLSLVVPVWLFFKKLHKRSAQKKYQTALRDVKEKLVPFAAGAPNRTRLLESDTQRFFVYELSLDGSCLVRIEICHPEGFVDALIGSFSNADLIAVDYYLCDAVGGECKLRDLQVALHEVENYLARQWRSWNIPLSPTAMATR